MKNLIIICFYLIAGVANGQQKEAGTSIKQPQYYLDSVKVDINRLFLNPASIESMDVKNEYDSNSNTYGKVFLKMKNHGFLLMSLKQVTDAHAERPVPDQLLYLINEKIITDTTDIRIDTSFIKNVRFIAASQIKYLKEIPKMTICIIETKSGNANNRIRIKGIERAGNKNREN